MSEVLAKVASMTQQPAPPRPVGEPLRAPSVYAKPNSPWLVKLEPSQEAAFRAWVAQNQHVPFVHNWRDNLQSDYDLRGYWQGLQKHDPHAATAVNPVDHMLHASDYYKTPYHESYSNESRTAQPDAPHWVDNTQVDKGGNVVFDEAKRGQQ